jgi:hypothetical protein
MVKSGMNKTNIVLYGLLLIMCIYGFYLSHFDWKLALMFSPVLVIMGYRTFLNRK